MDRTEWRRLAGLTLMAVSAAIMLLVPLARWYAQSESSSPSEASEPSNAKRDLVTGAQGALPVAFGTRAPTEPDHVTRPTTTNEAMVHGLGIRSTDTGVRAVNLRTGKQYWRYERRSKDIWDTWFKASERTVVVWFSDGGITAVDLRTGKPLWHTRIPGAVSDRTRLGQVVGGQVVTEVPGGVRAFAERDGRTLWTVRPHLSGGSCDETPVKAVYEFPDRLSAVLVSCDTLTTKKQRIDPDDFSPEIEVDVDKSFGILLGIDNRSGDALWQQRSSADDLLKGDENTLVALDPYQPTQRIDLLDVNRSGASRRAELSVKENWLSAASDGVVVSPIDPEFYAFDANTLLSGYDTQDGHLLWKQRAPSRQAYGVPVIADGRLYVVRQTDFAYVDADTLTDADLLVLDAHTGRLLHTLRLPALTTPKKVDSSTVLDLHVADGAIGVRWQTEEKDLLVITD